MLVELPDEHLLISESPNAAETFHAFTHVTEYR